MSSRKNRHSIRKGGFRSGASRNARNVDNQLDQLVEKKKNEIINLIRDLQNSGVITCFRIIRKSKRAIYFEASVAKKTIELQFFVWTDNTKPEDWSNANRAAFYLKVHEDIKEKVLDYLEGIERGCLTEYLHSLALRELEQEKRIHSFHKTGKAEDIRKKDFKIYFFKDGRTVELVLQVKSSKKALIDEKEDLLKRGFAGSFYEFEGDERKAIDEIKIKVMKIVNAFFEEGRLIYI